MKKIIKIVQLFTLYPIICKIFVTCSSTIDQNVLLVKSIILNRFYINVCTFGLSAHIYDAQIRYMYQMQHIYDTPIQ